MYCEIYDEAFESGPIMIDCANECGERLSVVADFHCYECGSPLCEYCVDRVQSFQADGHCEEPLCLRCAAPHAAVYSEPKRRNDYRREMEALVDKALGSFTPTELLDSVATRINTEMTAA